MSVVSGLHILATLFIGGYIGVWVALSLTYGTG